MSEAWLLSEAQMRRIEPYFPLSYGIPRADDRCIVSGIIYVIRGGLMWRDPPKAYGPQKTIYNRFIRWSRLGGVQPHLRRVGGNGRRARYDHDRRHPPQGASDGSQPLKRGVSSNALDPRRIGRTKGGLNSKLHAVCDDLGRSLVLLLSERQMSDYKGAALMIDALPRVRHLIGDRGYDADWFRRALAERGTAACILSKRNRKIAIPHNAALYRQRHRTEIMFARLKDWPCIHTRYDRCAHTFMSAICIAATFIFWLPQ
jgi:transposase